MNFTLGVDLGEITLDYREYETIDVQNEFYVKQT